MIQIRNARLGRVIGIYASAAFIVLQVIDLFQDRMDLPDWLFGAAVALLIIGLPVVIMTALVQSHDFKLQLLERNFTWRRAITAGGAAFAVLSLSAAGYVGSRSLGVGPAASLVTSGVLNRNDVVLIEQFETSGADSLLATTIAEAVRISLTASDKIDVLPREQVRETLDRMELPRSTPIQNDVAREMAMRVGAKALVRGRIDRIGSGYLLTVQLVSPQNGESLLAYNEKVRNEDDLIDAVDRLSRRVRKKIGDSLPGMRSEAPLAHVTTSSLEALKLYTQAQRAVAIEADLDRGVQLVEQAIQIDTAFAAAYRFLGAMLTNRNDSRARSREAVRKAYQYRDRLSRPEAAMSEYNYRSGILGDRCGAAEVARGLFESGDTSAANNLGYMLALCGRNRDAEPYLRLAIQHSPRMYYPYSNLASVLLDLGNVSAADSVAELLRENLPDNARYYRIKSNVAANRGAYDSAAYWSRELMKASGPALKSEAAERLGLIELTHGRTSRAAEYFGDLVAIETRRELRPDALRAKLLLALATAMSGSTVEAKKQIDMALREYPRASIDPADYPYGMLAHVYFVLSDTAAVVRTVSEELRERDAGDLRARSVMTAYSKVLRALAQNNAAAVIELTSETALPADREVLLPLRGRAFEMIGAADSAIATYEHFVTAPASDKVRNDGLFLGDTYHRLASLYEQRGDIDNARKYYGKLVMLWRGGDGAARQRANAAAARLASLTEG